MKVKICGLSTAEQVRTSIKYGADFCGFILNYPKSHRFIEFEKAKVLTKIEKKNTKYVAVLVNPNEDELEKFSKLNIDYFQIYGNYNSNLINFCIFFLMLPCVMLLPITTEVAPLSKALFGVMTRF